MRATPYPSRFSLAQDRITRREFALGAASLALARTQEPSEPKQSRVALARAGARKESLAEALALWGEVAVEGKEILLKASFNSPDESPATTSPELLAAVIGQLRARSCGRIRLVERSGMGRTRDIWDRLGITDLARRLDLALVPLDELAPEEWRHAELSGSHWSRGVELPGFLDRESTLVEISNCKTHRFGGHFSASLKNAVGLIAKYSHDGKRHNYMTELHASPDQRLMIAEVNQLFAPALVVLDATEVFVDGGPEQGDLAYPQVVAVATDRAALDAVGVALLRLHGAGPPLQRGGVFDLDQLKRAGELGLGARSLKEIRLVANSDDGRRVVAQVSAVLEREPEAK